MALFQAVPYITYTNSDFTGNNFGLAWGDVDGDGTPELLVSPRFITTTDQPVFLTFNGSTFVPQSIPHSDFPNNDEAFTIIDIDNDGKNEVLQAEAAGGLGIWKWNGIALDKTSDISFVGNGLGDIAGATINGNTYLFAADSFNNLISIYRVSDYVISPQGTFNPGLSQVRGVTVQDIDCDDHFEMAVSGGGAFDGRAIRFFRLSDAAIITSWQNLNQNLVIQNTPGFSESVVFANLECPHRWDLVVTTSVGSSPADILVYRNITNACPGCASIPVELSTLSMLFRLFGFLIAFILFGLALRRNSQ